MGDLPDVATYTFDYSDHSLAWVTDPAIGPALAAAIACIAGEHDRKVVTVAHSMGGLAVQFAQGQTVGGRPVAERLRDVITVGTPFDGAQLLAFASGAGGVVFHWISDAARGTCDEQARQRHARDFCGLLGTTETPAVRAMIPGSVELDALPAWQPGVVRHPIAGDIDVTVGVFGLEQVLGLGDLAVSVDSAVAGASRGVQPFVAGCHSGLLDVFAAIDDSPCSHTNQLANRRVERHVRRARARRRQAVGALNRVREVVEAQRCLPEDRGTIGPSDRPDPREELVDGCRERRVRVGEVARPDHVVCPHVLDDGRRQRVLGVRRDHALAGEVLGGGQREVGTLGVEHPLAVLVEASQPVRQPPGSRLEERDAELGVALEHAAQQQRDHRRHLLERMGARVARGEAREAVGPDGRAGTQAERLVHGQHATRLLEGGIEGRPRRGIEVVATEVVGADEHAGEAEARDPSSFDRGERRVARHHRDAGQAGRLGRAVLGDPVVVRTTRRGGRVRVELGEEGDEQPHGREQHCRVDALCVHGSQVRRRVEPRVELVA